jgi:hypothetical protein
MYLTIPLEDNAEHCDFNVVCLKRPSHCLPAGDQVERRTEQYGLIKHPWLRPLELDVRQDSIPDRRHHCESLPYCSVNWV